MTDQPHVDHDAALEPDWPTTDDAWHAHAAGERHMHAHGQSAAPFAIALTGAIGFIIFGVCVTLITFYFHQEVQREQVEKIERADMQTEFRKREAEWQHRLTAAGEKVDVPTGEAVLVEHTLAQAMDQVAQEYARQP